MCACAFLLRRSSLAQAMQCSNMPGCYACDNNYLAGNEVHWVYLSEKEFKDLQKQKRSRGAVIHRTDKDREFYLPMCGLCVSTRMSKIRCAARHHMHELQELMQDQVNSAVLDYVCDSICDGRLQPG